MRHNLFTLIIFIMTIATTTRAQLDDVTEISDPEEVKRKLHEVEQQFLQDPSLLNKVRLGIIYHETALNLTFLANTEYKGFAQKSYDHLTELYGLGTPSGMMPFVAAYRASALSLVSAETRKLKLLGIAFELFDDAVQQYSDVSCLPEFLRGSVAENLPWFFFRKKKFAKRDFQSIIERQDRHPGYADWKIMSYTYWAWANQHQGRKYRSKSLYYLDLAIGLDPNFKAGRARAEALKLKLSR